MGIGLAGSAGAIHNLRPHPAAAFSEQGKGMAKERFKASVSVFSIVRKDGKVLMILRSTTEWMDGHWSLPAGAMDGGETASAAAVRELREEACLVADPSEVSLAHTQHSFTHGDGWIGLYFEVGRVEGEPAVGEPHKHGAVGWFPLGELPENTLPYVRQALECVSSQDSFSIHSDQ